MKNPSPIKKMAIAAMFIAIGFYLPFLTGQIPEIGRRLLPMHLPVLLCGFVCGGPYGLAVGAILPVMRSLFTTMPVMYPTAVAMSFELAAYGLLTGILFKLLPKKPAFIYINLIFSMLGGRIVWGIARSVMAGLGSGGFGLAVFWADGFAGAVPGIILQIVAIPALIFALQRARLLESE